MRLDLTGKPFELGTGTITVCMDIEEVDLLLAMVDSVKRLPFGDKHWAVNERRIRVADAMIKSDAIQWDQIVEEYLRLRKEQKDES